MKIKTQYNEADFDRVQEVNKKPSETVPNMALSVQEILRRFGKGLPIDAATAVGEYDDEDSEYLLPDLAKMDLADREQLLRETKEEVERLRGIMNQKVAEKRDKDAAEQKDKEFREWQKREQDKEDEEVRKFVKRAKMTPGQIEQEGIGTNNP